MGAPLLSLIQDAQTELGLPVSQFAIRSPDATGRQFGGLATRLGNMLLRQHDWTYLTREFHISVPAPQTATGYTYQGGVVISSLTPMPSNLQPYQTVVSGAGIMTATRVIAVNSSLKNVTIDQPAMATAYNAALTFSQDLFSEPPDFERAINRTHWDRTMRWELRGPQTPQSDQWVRSGIVATGPRRQYRQINGGYRIWPVPGSSPSDTGSQISSEYVSNYWVVPAGQTWPAGASRFNADSDTCMFPDDVMITGLKLLFWQIKGFDTTAVKFEFQQCLESAISMDGPAQTLDMSRRAWPIFVSPANVPDTGFGGVGTGISPSGFGNP